MQVVFNVLVVVGCSIEKVDPGFCLLSLAGRRQPAAPPPVAVRQSSGRPPVQPAMCVGGGPQPAACAKKVNQFSGRLPEDGFTFSRAGHLRTTQLIYRWRQSQKQAAVKGVSSLCSLLYHRRAHPSIRTASVLSTRLRDCQACGRIGRETHGKYM